MKWRLIITPALHPRLNMALDEVLLDSVQPSRPTLRLYSWRPPGISLGHFQRVSPGQIAEWERRGFTLVRRLTGGGAIVHQNDLTYSLVIADLAELGLSEHAGLYDLAHNAFALALRRLGIEARTRGGRNVHREAFFCSERKSAHDLMCGDRKMLGSAQRRRGEAILQHGSLPLLKNETGEDVLSAGEAAGRAVSFVELSGLLRAAFAEGLKADLSDAQFTPDEWAEARRLADGKYPQIYRKTGERSCPT